MSSYGDMNSSITPGATATFMSSDALFSPAASATDIWTMAGSSTKTIKILHIGLHYSGTSAGFGVFYLLRRSSANTGGTNTTTTPGKMDTNNSASTCTIKAYTANPSALGTQTAQLLVCTISPSAALVNNVSFVQGLGDIQIFNYNLTGQPIVLRGTNDILALNCNGTAPGGGTVKLSISVVFTEE